MNSIWMGGRSFLEGCIQIPPRFNFPFSRILLPFIEGDSAKLSVVVYGLFVEYPFQSRFWWREPNWNVQEWECSSRKVPGTHTWRAAITLKPVKCHPGEFCPLGQLLPPCIWTHTYVHIHIIYKVSWEVSAQFFLTFHAAERFQALRIRQNGCISSNCRTMCWRWNGTCHVSRLTGIYSETFWLAYYQKKSHLKG